ncbi:MAG: hypothetical protein QOJ11_2371 [Frankiales bacterium]|jgi:hypothetical protein|nr:hypothetical protein [Frankiales bacterium]
MTELQQLMREAADHAPRADDLVGAAHRVTRGHRRRRLGAVSAGAVVAVSITGLVSTMSWTVFTGEGRPGAGGLAAQCYGGFARPMPVSAVAGSVLLSSSSAYRLAGPLLARMDKETCTRTAIPIVYRSVDHGTITRAFAVTGPAGPDKSTYDSTYDPAPMTVAVRGTTGRLQDGPGTGAWLEWTEPDGRGWKLSANGLTTIQMLAIAEGLTLGDSAGVDPTTVPAGMVAQASVPLNDTAEHPIFYATYTSAAGTFNLSVASRQESTTSDAARSGQPTPLLDIQGHEAILLSRSSTGSKTIAMLAWQQNPGSWVTVSAAGVTDAQIKAFAKSLTPVNASDPRLSRNAKHAPSK